MTSFIQPNILTKEKYRSLEDMSLPAIELISEEKMPSLLSLGMADSMCSNSTVDLEAFEQTDQLILINDTHSHSKPNSSIILDGCRPHTLLINGLDSNDFELRETPLHQSSMKNNTSTSNFRKCMSLHDVSHIQPLQLSAKSLNTISCETIHSQSLSSTTKSKDSGFQRSVSCLSFSSGRRNYDHVQSKVKAYIKNIKESEALRKKNKSLEQNEAASEPTIVLDNVGIVMDKEDLILKIKELKHELQEKALYIDVQQQNYNSLLLKLAEAKNTIDKLRLERISLDYSTSFTLGNLNNASYEMKSYDFNSFEYKQAELTNPACARQIDPSNDDTFDNVTRQMVLQSNPDKKSIISKEQSSFESSHSSKVNPFKPSKCSTPDKAKTIKSLNPVYKISSSSSRLDKYHKPLENLHKIGNSRSTSHSVNDCHVISKLAKYSSHHRACNNQGHSITAEDRCVQVKEAILKKKFNSSSPRQIDLPNVDPFDKVKKWQASLPNLNLLETNSSSDYEAVGKQHLDQNETNCSRCTLPDFKENEINGFLSEQLVAKCRISETKNEPGHQNIHFEPGRTTTALTAPAHMDDGGQINDNPFSSCRPSQNQRKHLKHTNGSGSDSLQKDHLQRSSFQGQRTNFPIHFCNINDYESESQSNRAQSSPTHSAHSQVESDCSDSQSLSSSVLSSDKHSSVTKPAKCEFGEKCTDTSSKIPKLTTRKRHSPFVLREPKLNITLPLTSVEIKSEKTMKNSSISAKSSTFDPKTHFRTESSQRKAWNSRNNTNFYVCKEFYYKKSASLEDCFHALEGMTQKASSIIDIALDRSNY